MRAMAASSTAPAADGSVANGYGTVAPMVALDGVRRSAAVVVASTDAALL